MEPRSDGIQALPKRGSFGVLRLRNYKQETGLGKKRGGSVDPIFLENAVGGSQEISTYCGYNKLNLQDRN